MESRVCCVSFFDPTPPPKKQTHTIQAMPALGRCNESVAAARATFLTAWLAERVEAEAGRVLPAVQAAQVPEHAAVARPAWSPNVPAGQSVQASAPARE